MKRISALLGLIALLTLGGFAAPAGACACGAPAPEPGSEVDVDRENAMIRWDGQTEEIVMQLDLRSDSGSTGLVVPTPTPATVSLGDAELFEQLVAEMAPRVITRYDWWGGFGLGSSAGAPEGGAPPEVLAQVQLGPIEATTLAASDTEGLQTWLDDNGFALSEAVEAELDPYVRDGWSFVALRLTGAEPLDGALDPIRFEFATDEFVYPMRMSRASEHEQNLRLYIIGDHRAVVTNSAGAEYTVPHAGPIESADLRELGAFLTVSDLFWAEPGSQITEDLVLADAPDDTPVIKTFTQVEQVQVLGFPAGPVLVALGVVLLLVAIVVVVAVLTRRSRRV